MLVPLAATKAPFKSIVNSKFPMSQEEHFLHNHNNYNNPKNRNMKKIKNVFTIFVSEFIYLWCKHCPFVLCIFGMCLILLCIAFIQIGYEWPVRQEGPCFEQGHCSFGRRYFLGLLSRTASRYHLIIVIIVVILLYCYYCTYCVAVIMCLLLLCYLLI